MNSLQLSSAATSNTALAAMNTAVTANQTATANATLLTNMLTTDSNGDLLISGNIQAQDMKAAHEVICAHGVFGRYLFGTDEFCLHHEGLSLSTNYSILVN